MLLGVAEARHGRGRARTLARKVTGLRVFEDEAGEDEPGAGRHRRGDAGGEPVRAAGGLPARAAAELVAAARPDRAERLYQLFVSEVRDLGTTVAMGRFQQHMEVSLVNDGPVTLLLDSTKRF